LAILLQHPNAIVSTDHVLAELWGDAPPASANNSIHVYISRLRKELGPDRVIARPPGYALRVDPPELDLVKFERLRAEGRVREALALWRGPAQAERARLEELRLVTLEERVDADLANGRHADLVGELEAMIGEHPLRERLRGQLMLALYGPTPSEGFPRMAVGAGSVWAVGVDNRIYRIDPRCARIVAKILVETRVSPRAPRASGFSTGRMTR
jgi:DNA-binding SARP family transcriptional activator